MKKCTAYIFTLEEAEEALQKCLDNSGIRLKEEVFFYNAESDDIFLDGSEVDERMAQILGVGKCEHYAIESGMVVIVEQED